MSEPKLLSKERVNTIFFLSLAGLTEGEAEALDGHIAALDERIKAADALLLQIDENYGDSYWIASAVADYLGDRSRSSPNYRATAEQKGGDEGS